MTIRNINAPNPDIFAKLEALPYEFVQYGSRALGLHTPDSDYDFLVVRNPKLQLDLVEIGFTKDRDVVYEDRSGTLVACLQYGKSPTFPLHKREVTPKIDVLVVTDEEFARRMLTLHKMKRILERKDASSEALKTFFKTLKKNNDGWASVHALVNFEEDQTKLDVECTKRTFPIELYTPTSY